MKTISTAIGNIDALDHELLFLDAKYKKQAPFIYVDMQSLQENTSPLSKFITSHIEFSKILDIFQNDPRSSFSLFEVMRNLADERLVKAFFVYMQERYALFDYCDKQLTMDQIRSKKLMTLEKSCREKIVTDAQVFLIDLRHYTSLENTIICRGKEEFSIQGQKIPVEFIRKHFQKTILSSIASNNRRKRTNQSYTAENICDDLSDSTDVLDSYGIMEHASAEQKTINTLASEPEIVVLAEKYAFFKLIQNSAAKGYVLSKSELVLISDILRDLKSGKVVLLTGDTGSGKTELARFLCREYLKKDPVFISGSKDMDVADFTIEKIITSRSPLSYTSRDSIIVEEEINPVKVLEKKAYSFISLLNHKKELQKMAENYADSGQSKKEIADFFNTFELGKSSLITEYHLMAIYKAAELGRPIIIDEVNLIRPEIIMALNDILTRRVGDTIQLPNALGSLVVRPGFCIIMTGNDPDQNSKNKRYVQARYHFDEASYNRFRVYAKSYATQKFTLFTENAIVNDSVDETEQYLSDNELYGIILQMMLQQEGNIMKVGKYGFEIMKRDLDGKSLDRDQVFASFKNLAHAISAIQNAYAGNCQTLTSPQFKTLSLSTSIQRKVFSMRNLLEVCESYKTDIRPMEYHIYREFIKLTTNREEQYALLAIFQEYDFFAHLITDDLDKSLQNIKTLFQKLESMKYSFSDIENKIIITKQDIYAEYFGSFDFPDHVYSRIDFEDSPGEVEDISSHILEKTNAIVLEDLITYCDALSGAIERRLDIFTTEEFFFLHSIIVSVRAGFIDDFVSQSPKKRAYMSELLVTMINLLNNTAFSVSKKAVCIDLMRSIDSGLRGS